MQAFPSDLCPLHKGMFNLIFNTQLDKLGLEQQLMGVWST